MTTSLFDSQQNTPTSCKHQGANVKSTANYKTRFNSFKQKSSRSN